MTCCTFRLSFLLLLLALSTSGLLEEDFETGNAAILNRLGLVPLPNGDSSSSGHHRKRLAPGESNYGARVHQSSFGRRHNANGHDSHVYVVKLPASPPYYSFAKPDKDRANVTSVANPEFKNNGKPAKIYHWNLPLVKKINEKRKQTALLKLEQARKKLEAERERQKVTDKLNFLKKLAQEQLVAKPSRNNDKWLSDPEKIESRTKSSPDTATQMKILSANKIYRLDDSGSEASDNWLPAHQHRNELPGRGGLKKHKKKSAGVSYYYAPNVNGGGGGGGGNGKSTSISKHFSGNGKPKAFYVMEKSRKPAYYHPLMP